MPHEAIDTISTLLRARAATASKGHLDRDIMVIRLLHTLMPEFMVCTVSRHAFLTECDAGMRIGSTPHSRPLADHRSGISRPPDPILLLRLRHVAALPSIDRSQYFTGTTMDKPSIMLAMPHRLTATL